MAPSLTHSSYANVGQVVASSQYDQPYIGDSVERKLLKAALAVSVPCHRVMDSDGTLTGYAGGLERKTALLRLEGAMREELA